LATVAAAAAGEATVVVGSGIVIGDERLLAAVAEAVLGLIVRDIHQIRRGEEEGMIEVGGVRKLLSQRLHILLCAFPRHVVMSHQVAVGPQEG
jgi:hypothetical protein